MAEPEAVSTPIEGRSSQMKTDRADEPKELGGDMASPDGKPQHQKAQVAGETSET